MRQNKSFFDNDFPPSYQAMGVFGLGFVFMLLGMMTSDSTLTPWITAATFLLLYAILNSIKSLVCEDLNKYWGKSILCYIGLVLGFSTIAYLISGVTVDEASSIQWIFIVLTFCYLVFLSITGFMKNLIAYFRKEDDNLRKDHYKD